MPDLSRPDKNLNRFPISLTIPLISLNLGKYSIDLFLLDFGNPIISDDTQGLSSDRPGFVP